MATALDRMIGLRLREIREWRNLSQADVACALHVSPGAVKYWERGSTALTLAWIEQLARVLHVKPGAFLKPPGAPLRLHRATVGRHALHPPQQLAG